MRMLTLFLILLASVGTLPVCQAAQNTLMWEDNSSDEWGFEIQRAVAGEAFAPLASIGANLTAYTDSAVSEGTTYCYRVRAFHATAASAYSNEACGVARPPVARMSLALLAGPDPARPGAPFRSRFELKNEGPQWPVDAYFGVFLPAEAGPRFGCTSGDALALWADWFTHIVVTCMSAFPQNFVSLARGINVAANAYAEGPLLETSWPLGLPLGEYVFAGALTAPGAFLDGRLDEGDLIEYVEFPVLLTR